MLRTQSLSLVLSYLALVLVPLSADAGVAPVIGGKASVANAWNEVVAVVAETGMCTGTLIAPDVVLTAGHCAVLEPYEVITNTVDYDAPGGDHIKVKWSRAYPDWEHRYDVGVLMLEHVARPKPRVIAAACLANDQLAKASPLTVVGFGLTTPSGHDDNTRMHEATIPVLDPACASDPACEPSIRPNGEFIAGGRGTDSCFGDSGGPVFLTTDAGPVLAGVVSRGTSVAGTPCGNGGIYVRADQIVAWAEGVTNRRFARTSCTVADAMDTRGDDPDAGAGVHGGCSAAGPGAASAGIALGLALLGLRRRRTA